jgi:putative MATE family efflux protein
MDGGTYRKKHQKIMPPKPLPYSNKGDLTTGPVRGHLMRLALPMVWALLAVISVQLVDTYFIAMLGTNELAGISFTFPVTMLISHLVFGLNVAMSSVISRLIGEKKIDDVKRVTLHGVALAFIVSSVIALIAYLSLDPLFHFMGADEATMPVIRDYMPLWLIGSALLAIPVNGNSAIRANGDTYLPSLVMISIALINLILAPIMIFGLFGFPALQVFGAALATLISYICGTLFGLYVLIIKKDMLPHDGLHLDKVSDSIKRLAVIAIPAGITNIITPATSAVIVAILAQHGPGVVAAFGVATRIEAFSMLFVIALALGMAPIVGQNWGARLFRRVHEVIHLSILINFGWSLAIAAIFGFFARDIGAAFSQDPDVIEYVAFYFWIVPVTYGFGNLVFGWSAAFNAMGMPQRAFFMITAKSLVMTIPAVFIASHFYQVNGVFMALALVNIASGVIFHVMSWRACMRHEMEALNAAA